MEEFTTVYFTDDFDLTDQEIIMLERCIGRDISAGGGFVNIYSRDKEIVQAFVDLVGDFYIKEVAYDVG